ncbi:hypothetical protein HYH03_014087 [Edaphochlamys debaryana]|uniref:CxC3 like cysteine cluster domain-containing protein n=1 Tax=Edaphochlamys debaryana TaxID=47281 RepID=A0A835XPG8_9CHLO|nr:hypothetical protein HYH03_014087 [Edaphochlamys debaryana]|eukprot:KAG2487245.1 hypothetical protein HYH03_014087 [Edaphochlamys debaryana]
MPAGDDIPKGQRSEPSKVTAAPTWRPASPPPQEQHQRAHRPGQLVPRGGQGAKKRARAGVQHGGAPAAAGAPLPNPRSAAHRQRVEREEAAWDAASPALEQAFVTHAHLHAQQERELAAAILAIAQRRVDSACERLCAAHSRNCAGATFSWVVGAETQLPLMSVRYVGLNCSGIIYLSTAKCSRCGDSFTPTAIEAGCFVSSPVDAHAWYDLQVHKAYGVLCCDGLSVTGFTDFLEAMAVGAPCISGTGAESDTESDSDSELPDQPCSPERLSVDRRRFFASFMACQRARFMCTDLQRLGVTGMDTGALCGCPICSRRPQPPGSEGAEGAQAPEDTPYPLAVAMDACGNKLGHYSSCGAASRDLKPRLSSCFGPVDARVQALHGQGRLNLRSTLGDADADAEADACVCQSSLHCSRPEAPASSGPLDVHGVCGAVCMHGFPVRGIFCDMQTPEQFAYYLLMLGHLVKERPDLKHVYIDFGCRFKHTWSRYVARQPDLPQSAAQLKIMVNWMHGAGHDLACQLTNSGRFTEGAGRQIGEEIEQLWSSTKPVGPLARYMTLARRRDFIEMALASVSRAKSKRVVQLLVRAYKRTVAKIRESEVEVRKAESAARAAGVEDPAAAAARFVQSAVGTSPPGGVPGDTDAWQMDYVLLRLRRAEMEGLKDKAPSLAVVSSSSAVALAAASTSAQITKVDAALRRLEGKHGLLPDGWKQWKRGHGPFDAALQRLCEREVSRCQARIGAYVLEVQHGQQERAQAGCADRETKRIQSRLKRKRSQIRTLLDEMYVWQGMQLGPSSVQRLTEDQVKGLYVPGRQPPWATPSSSDAALNLFHGRKCHEAASELARAREHLGYVQMDKSRLENWISGALACIGAARAAKAVTGCQGSVHLLDCHLADIQALHTALGASERLLSMP